MRCLVFFALLAVCALAQDVNEDSLEYPSLHERFLRAHSHTFYDPDDPARELSCKNLAPYSKAHRWGCIDRPSGNGYPSVSFRCMLYFIDGDSVFGKHCTVLSYSGDGVLIDGFSDARPLPPPPEPDEDEPVPEDTNATLTDGEPDGGDDADSEGYGAPDEFPELDDASDGMGDANYEEDHETIGDVTEDDDIVRPPVDDETTDGTEHERRGRRGR